MSNFGNNGTGSGETFFDGSNVESSTLTTLEAQCYLHNLLCEVREEYQMTKDEYEKGVVNCTVKNVSRSSNSHKNGFIFELETDSVSCIDIHPLCHLQLYFADVVIAGMVCESVCDDLKIKRFSLGCNVSSTTIPVLEKLNNVRYQGKVTATCDSTTFERKIHALNLLTDKLSFPKSLSLFEMQLLNLAECKYIQDLGMQFPCVSLLLNPMSPPLNQSQTFAYVSALVNLLTILLAPAGTGKTKVSVQVGLSYALQTREKNEHALQNDISRSFVGAFFATNQSCSDYAGKLQTYLMTIEPTLTLTLVQSQMEEAAAGPNPPEYTLYSRVRSRIRNPEEGDSESAHWIYLQQHVTDDSLLEPAQYVRNYALAEKDVLAQTDFVCATFLCAGDQKMSVFDQKISACIFEDFGQVSVPDCAVALPLLRPDARIFVVGDNKQLGPFSKCELLFPNLCESGVERLLQIQQPLKLTEELRMEQQITAFVSKQFYNNELIMPPSSPPRRLPHPTWDRWYHPSLSLLWFHVKASSVYCRGNSLVNDSEIDMAIGFLEYLLAMGIVGGTYMIITPYVAHRDVALVRVKERLPNYPALIDVCTIDGSQGKEADVCIVCATVPRENEFFADLRRQAVALTRARLLTIAMGNVASYSKMTVSFGQLAQQLFRQRLVFSGEQFPLQRLRPWKKQSPRLCYQNFFDHMQYDINLQNQEIDLKASTIGDEPAQGRALERVIMNAKKKIRNFSSSCCKGEDCDFDHLSETNPVCLQEILSAWQHLVGQDAALKITLLPLIEKSFREGPCKKLVFTHGIFPDVEPV